jgi:anti-sigma regulatory factor (Ser/Thr protein kinase)
VEDETGGTPQLIAIVDSLQAMVPEDNDGDEVSNAKGIEARMHGENLKRVRGRLRAKHSLVIVIGQLREKPMVMFGTPEYTPGGNTLNHADDVRNKFTKRASPNGGDNVDRRTGFENEVSVIKAGAMDSYQYINVKNEKNKFGLPRRECWLRVWVDHTGKSRGYCPAYDCYQYLIATGRILESNDNKSGKIYKKFTVNWPEKGFDEVKMTWLDFKALCLARGENLKEVCLNLGFKKNPKIKTVIRNLISNAIKFSNEGSEVVVSLAEEDGMAIVSVKDSGCGIDDENQKKLLHTDTHFSTFGTNNEEGSGLGLLLCQDFVVKNGGKLWFTSKKGDGSTFSFSIPLLEK